MGRDQQGQEASTCRKLPWGGQGGVSENSTSTAEAARSMEGIRGGLQAEKVLEKEIGSERQLWKHLSFPRNITEQKMEQVISVRLPPPATHVI